jgi:hypothetical protein
VAGPIFISFISHKSVIKEGGSKVVANRKNKNRHRRDKNEKAKKREIVTSSLPTHVILTSQITKQNKEGRGLDKAAGATTISYKQAVCKQRPTLHSHISYTVVKKERNKRSTT